MGFDGFVEGGGAFVKKEEKAELIASGTPLEVVRIGFRQGDKYGDSWIMTFNLDDEERALSFVDGSVESRDATLRNIGKYLDDNAGETVTVKLQQAGNAVLVVSADE